MRRVFNQGAWLAGVFLALSLAAGPAAAETSLGTQALRGAAIGFAVTQFAKPLDSFINTITLRHNVATKSGTKVVPILSVGEKGYIGGAQVSGPKVLVDRVQAVFQYEKNFDSNNYRAKVLLPSASLNPLEFKRVEKVGVTAIIDVSLDGKLRYHTVGTGIQAGDVLRGAAVVVAVKNAGDILNKGINVLTFNKGTATRVVPMGSIGEKGYIGGAQVSASATEINRVKAVWQYEDLFSDGRFRVKVMVPTTAINPLEMKRVDGAGVTAVIDMAVSQQKEDRRDDYRNEAYRKERYRKESRYDALDGRIHRHDDDRYRRDNGKHKGWEKGKRKGRKHPWVDEKHREKVRRHDD